MGIPRFWARSIAWISGLLWIRTAILALRLPLSIDLATASKLLPLPDAITPRISGGKDLVLVIGVGEIRLGVSVMNVRKVRIDRTAPRCYNISRSNPVSVFTT